LHLVEAAGVQERSQAVDEVGDLVAVGELSYLTLEASYVIESRSHGSSFL
jgi:hypothetical protein